MSDNHSPSRTGSRGAPALADYLDAWGDTFFNQTPIAPTKPRRGLRGVLRPVLNSAHSTQTARGSTTRGKLDSIARKTPEVLVKISGGGKGMRQIKDHLDYISRNGKLDLEDQDGQTLAGRQDLGDLRDEWRHGAVPIPDDGTKREAFNIVLSMPAGTDPLAVKRAARDFAAHEFAGHQYAMVLHTYETDPDPTPSKNPHVHLCVKAQAEDGTRLNPRKADLQRWREHFAQALREHGVDATATKRAHRIKRDRADSQAVYHRKVRGAEPRGDRPDPSPQPLQATPASTERTPAGAKLEATRRQILTRYRELIATLAQAEDAADRKLAVDLVRRLADNTGVDIEGLPARHPASQAKTSKPHDRGSSGTEPDPVR